MVNLNDSKWIITTVSTITTSHGVSYNDACRDACDEVVWLSYLKLLLIMIQCNGQWHN